MARRTGFLHENNKFYILTNGKCSEKLYFDLLKKKQTMYKVEVKFVNGTPLDVVNECVKIVGNANQVWALFDIDEAYNEEKLEPAIQLANKSGVRYAFSNKAFEVWLISHFEQFSRAANNDELIVELNKLVNSNMSKPKIEYKKNDEQLIKDRFIPKYKDAVNNAKIVYQTKTKDQKMLNSGKVKIWDMCSCTTVFMLVEALKL